MKTLRKENNFANQEIEFEEDKILIFMRNFWRFSKYYGEYLASLHSERKS